MGADKRPEELINHYVKARFGVQKIASTIGFFALLWSTVVLLGGFISILRIQEFWFLSVLSLLMASKMLEMDTRTLGNYVADIHILRLSKGQIQLEGANRSCQWMIISIASTAVAVKLIFTIFMMPIISVSPYVALALSVSRLVQRDYGDAGGDAANKAKLNGALIIFYVLVMFQSLSVSYWAFLQAYEPWMLLSKQFGFGVWGPKIIRSYRKETGVICRKNGVLPNNWSLITFSVGLLESASPGNRLWGARVLDTFSGRGIPIRQELLSSSKAIQNLVDMIGLTSKDNREIRERAARIVADLATELLITQFPDALRGICCLLESSKQYIYPQVAHPLENSERTVDENYHRVSVKTFEHSHHQEEAHLSLAITEQIDHKQDSNLLSGELPKRRSWIQTLSIRMFKTPKEMKEWEIYFGDKYCYSYASKGTKELISQGLVILERLTQDEDNCIEIIKHRRLLSKITVPLSYQYFLVNGWDNTWVEMLSRLLTVVSRLIRAGPGDDTTRLRHDMWGNTVVIHNLMAILEVDKEFGRQIHEQAIVILTELALDDSFRKLAFDESTSMTQMFVKRLQHIFLEVNHGNTIAAEQDEQKDNTVRRKAGEALTRLFLVPTARDNSDELPSTTNVHVVDLLPKKNMIYLLTRVVDQILSSKVESAEDVATPAGASNNNFPEENQPPNGCDARQSSSHEKEQPEEIKLLATMLSLAVAICNKNVISGDDFTRAVPDDVAVALVKKLKEMVDTNKDATTNGWRTLKLVCQGVIAMAQLKPSCIGEFRGHSFREALSKASENMSDVDKCMLFAGNDREFPGRSLSSLVKEVHELLSEEQGDVSA